MKSQRPSAAEALPPDRSPHPPCTCGRNDGWHHVNCNATSTAAILDYRQEPDGKVVYRRRQNP